MFSLSQISDKLLAGFELAQNLSSGFFEYGYAVVITATPPRGIMAVNAMKIDFNKIRSRVTNCSSFNHFSNEAIVKSFTNNLSSKEFNHKGQMLQLFCKLHRNEFATVLQSFIKTMLQLLCNVVSKGGCNRFAKLYRNRKQHCSSKMRVW